MTGARRFAFAVWLALASTPLWAGLDAPPTYLDPNIYSKKTEVPGLAPVQSVNSQQGVVTVKTPPSPLCQNTSIPSGNNVINSALETAFTSACYIPAGTIAGPINVKIDTWGLMGVNAVIPTLRGRVMLVKANSSVISCTGGATNTACSGVGTSGVNGGLINCIPANGCTVLLDTTPTGGLTAGSGLRWNAFVSLTFFSSTSVEAEGELNFQTGATAAIGIFASSAAATGDAAVTVDMSVDEYVVYAGDWSAASTSNYIQIRQMTGK